MCGAINVLPHTPLCLHINFLKKFCSSSRYCIAWDEQKVIGLKSISKKVIQKRNKLIHQFLKSGDLNFGGFYIHIYIYTHNIYYIYVCVCLCVCVCVCL
jgi:histidinol phosphatase-like enzyme